MMHRAGRFVLSAVLLSCLCSVAHSSGTGIRSTRSDSSEGRTATSSAVTSDDDANSGSDSKSMAGNVVPLAVSQSSSPVLVQDAKPESPITQSLDSEAYPPAFRSLATDKLPAHFVFPKPPLQALHPVYDGTVRVPSVSDYAENQNVRNEGGMNVNDESEDAGNEDEQKEEEYIEDTPSEVSRQRVKRGGYNAPYFVGKKSLEMGEEIEQEELQKRDSLSMDEPDNGFLVPEDLKETLTLDKRGSPMFVGKRRSPMFVGKRRSPMFVGKRRSPMFVGKRRSPMFVGKRRSPMFVGRRRAPYFIGKRDPEMSEERAAFFMASRAAPMFVGRRAAPMFVGKRQAPMFIGKRAAAPMFVGKRSATTNPDEENESSQVDDTSNEVRDGQSDDQSEEQPVNEVESSSEQSEEKRRSPMFVGKRRSPMFVGKRRSPMFVGKRRSPMFVGKRRSPMFVGKRRSPMFVGKRRSPMFVGKRRSPMFVGKRRSPMFVGKRRSPMFVGKRRSPMFVGKRENEGLHELLAALQTLQAARHYRRMIQADKRHNAPFFVGRRSSVTEESSFKPLENKHDLRRR